MARHQGSSRLSAFRARGVAFRVVQSEDRNRESYIGRIADDVLPLLLHSQLELKRPVCMLQLIRV